MSASSLVLIAEELPSSGLLYINQLRCELVVTASPPSPQALTPLRGPWQEGPLPTPPCSPGPGSGVSGRQGPCLWEAGDQLPGEVVLGARSERCNRRGRVGEHVHEQPAGGGGACGRGGHSPQT